MRGRREAARQKTFARPGILRKHDAITDDDTLRDRARTMRRAPTDAETALWRILRDRRFSGYKFRRQVPLGDYIVDFVCFSERLIVEADGSQHAESDYDTKRDAWLRAQGFRIRRFWNVEILTQRQMVGDTLWHDLSGE